MNRPTSALRPMAASLALTCLFGCTQPASRAELHDPHSHATPHAMQAPRDTALATSPTTLAELKLLQESLLFGEDDVAALRMSKPLLESRTEEILDVWYGFVASTPQLVESFKNLETGQPDADYLAKVRVRFGQWIADTARAEYDQEWLDYQYEIGLRHHSTKKNLTDGADSTPIIPLRYVIALVYPVTATLRPFLESGDHSPEDVDRMHQAWTKSVLLQAILWSQPYVKDGEF